MYPNLYYAVKDWFGVEINAFKIFYTFGIFVAIAFIVGPRAAESVLSPADARPGRTRPPRCFQYGSEWSTRRCGRGTCRRETGRRAIESRTPRSHAPPCQRPRYSAVTDRLGPP